MSHLQEEDWVAFRDELLREAKRRGFVAAGIASVEPYTQEREWAIQALETGRMEGMDWYTRHHIEMASDFRAQFPWVQSVLSLAWPYRPSATPGLPMIPLASVAGRPRGRISGYACTTNGTDGNRRTLDYHIHLSRACAALRDWIRQSYPDAKALHQVDHKHSFDRACAVRAGLGFTGKHAQLLTASAGSYVFLAELLLSLPLPPTSPTKRNCGTCSACLPACPTGAILAPGVIDGPRCIAYLTIEHRGAIPEHLRSLMGTWIFGCDVCQEACPINKRLAPTPLECGDATTARGPVPYPDLVECLELTQQEFEKRFAYTPVWRTGREGLARNAAIALGNAGDTEAIPALETALQSDPDLVVRESAAWSLATLKSGRVRSSHDPFS